MIGIGKLLTATLDVMRRRANQMHWLLGKRHLDIPSGAVERLPASPPAPTTPSDPNGHHPSVPTTVTRPAGDRDGMKPQSTPDLQFCRPPYARVTSGG